VLEVGKPRRKEGVVWGVSVAVSIVLLRSVLGVDESSAMDWRLHLSVAALPLLLSLVFAVVIHELRKDFSAELVRQRVRRSSAAM
jgi:hypothetical protein